ncbi:Holin-like protein CidA [Klebsiella variicola]|uniref:Holin-like protein CidA n=1 Tax=Klebsiella variicola TaxID=244366 RepID=A0A7H4MBH8_KLEVA|nr:Holin-like protein CidA [Klebsiella variicola]
MAFAPARVAPAVAQRLQIPLQVLLMSGYLFCAISGEQVAGTLPANLVGM